MKKIILIRHGESEDNVKNIIQNDNSPLTEKGRNHAFLISEELSQKFSLSNMFSSTSTRALQTAEIIHKKLPNVEIIKMKGLAAPDCGETIGTLSSEISPLSPLEYAEKNKTGETRKNMFKRVSKSWNKIRQYAKTTKGDIAVVSHRSILSLIDAIEDEQDIEKGLLNRRNNQNRKHGIWRIIEL